MTLRVLVIFAAMAGAYAAAKSRRASAELSMFAAAVAGGLVAALFRTPDLRELPRHLVEGSITYLDVILLFFTATFFMALLNASGGVDFVVRSTLRRLARFRVAALLVLMVILLVPGALTGAGSVSLLVVGAPVAAALRGLGIAPRRVAAILFIIAGLSAAAPPVNIWAMILCAGTAIPYLGFELPLGLPVLVAGVFTMLALGLRKGGEVDVGKAIEALPPVSPRMRWWRVLLPFGGFFALVAAGRIWPFRTPILGLALEFAAAGAIAALVSPVNVKIPALARATVKRLLPLLATMVVVGMLQQIMTASGVKGLFSYAVLAMPPVLLFFLLPVVIPVSEGVLTYGGAAVIGIPLIWYLDSIGYHATVVISGLSLLWPLGDGLPPTALIGRLSIMVSGYEGSLGSVRRAAWLPWLAITAIAMLMVVFSSRLAFLVRWSM
jgi:CitMHS family citrate-Mg2+:H+ or citrate-Ca2+:H+ symporter